MLSVFVNSRRVRRVADRGIEALIAGANHLRFRHEITHPDNQVVRDNYRALRERQVSLRADLSALLSTGMYLESLPVTIVMDDLNRVADALAILKEDALGARPQRILREIVRSAAA